MDVYYGNAPTCWSRLRPAERSVRAALPLVLGVLTLAGMARAQDATNAAAGGSGSAAASRSDAALGIQGAPLPANGLVVGGFLVYPSIFVGAIYNDNLFTSENHRVNGMGLEFTPNVVAVDDQGIHKTTLTLNADATVYPDASRPPFTNTPSPNNVTGTASFDHVWKPTADLTVDVTGAFTRQNGIFGTFGAAGSSFVSSINTTSTAALNQNWNEASGALAIEKLLADRFYVRVGAGAQLTQYEALPLGGGSQSGASYDAFVRTGYWVTPQLSVFIEGGGDWARYWNGWYDTNGYRVIGGLRSDLIGLFRGEIYAGYQTQNSVSRVFGSVGAPAFGGRISYYPTRYLTLAVSLENSVGSAVTQLPPVAVVQLQPIPLQAIAGSPNGVTSQARFEADYSLATSWSLAVRGGWARTAWSNSPLDDTAWTFGGGLNYTYWRNIALTFNYQYTATTSNRNYVAVYHQNIISAGLTYHY
ncbi:hypothetical protein DFR50_12850 [Roseiarcus fermentans]|uniref:Uncharacterized protein n=1 Tax=Roseiarcus fermentans TaxID=1473586 RepID=A0A366F0U4_9HYPH|nr:outer membrane beta-barrel protein [Roseiarcus fermentans]RBP07325.1 hypothetical protein DFR50_12850 [Roseiarcus fermentans]